MLMVVRAPTAACETKTSIKQNLVVATRRRVGAHENKRLVNAGRFVRLKYMNMHVRHAITHTRHCLTGCGIGEILGSAIGQQIGLPNGWQTMLAVVLAFCFGYGLTYRGARKMGMTPHESMHTAFTTDTISIISMELIDNVLEWLIPGAMNAEVASILFWWSNALSLAVAFVFTVPVNYVLMKRGDSHAAMHDHHH